MITVLPRHAARAAALAALLLTLAAPRAALAQTPVQLDVTVRVTDRASGAPVTDAEVWLGRNRASTDSLGRAFLPLAHGRATLVVRRLGYEEVHREIRGEAYQLSVALAPAPYALRAVNATANRMPMSPPLQRYYARLERGRGAFITRQDIEKRQPRRMVDLFHEVPGVRVVQTGRGERLTFNGTTPYMWGSQGGQRGDCPVQYYLEGVSWEPDAPGVLGDDIRPNEVEGVEIYRRLSEVPAEYRKPGSECGVVLIWLKERV